MPSNDQAHRIYHEWDEHARSGDIDALLFLYVSGGTFESPLVPVLMNRESGVCRGHDEMRAFFEIGFQRRPNELVRWYRNGRTTSTGRR